MQIKLKNLGALRQAEFELGELSIICGQNNTGKTYATYALFGFLSFWREAFTIDLAHNTVPELLQEGFTKINLDDYVKNSAAILEAGCAAYTKQLPIIFASSSRNFEDSEFCVTLDSLDIDPLSVFERNIGSAKTEIFSINKKENDNYLNITLLAEKDQIKIPPNIIGRAIGDAIKEIIFGRLFPNPFIASAERTGAAIFRKELNFARNRILEQMSTMEKEINPLDLLTKAYADYALPVKTNVEFTRQLEELAKKESFITTDYPAILTDFSDIIGGKYMVSKNDELFYIPQGKQIKLTMDESSSAVRSLLDIGFYLRHVAKKGDLLMVDEPELNLHPENQRKVARLFARLVNAGIKVFITTHSDYIVKELNTLIMLSGEKPHLKEIAQREGYKPEEVLPASKIKVYIAEEASVLIDGGQRRTKCNTLTQAPIDTDAGIEAKSFDTTIDCMNRIQEEIIWGGSDDN